MFSKERSFKYWLTSCRAGVSGAVDAVDHAAAHVDEDRHAYRRAVLLELDDRPTQPGLENLEVALAQVSHELTAGVTTKSPNSESTSIVRTKLSSSNFVVPSVNPWYVNTALPSCSAYVNREASVG